MDLLDRSWKTTSKIFHKSPHVGSRGVFAEMKRTDEQSVITMLEVRSPNILSDFNWT